MCADALLSAVSVVHLLSTLHSHLELSYQSSLTASLLSITAALPVNRRTDCLGLPSLRLLIPIPLDSDQQPHHEKLVEHQADDLDPSLPGRLQRISDTADDVFLFSPDDDDADNGRVLSKKKRLRSARFVCGESIQVEALLSNPLRLPLCVQSIQLKTSGVEFVAHCSSIVLPPETASTSLILTGSALAAGSLRIEGCLIRCFNLLSEHSVDQAGVGIPPPHVRSIHRPSPWPISASCLLMSARSALCVWTCGGVQLTFVEQAELQSGRALCDVHDIQVEAPMPLVRVDSPHSRRRRPASPHCNSPRSPRRGHEQLQVQVRHPTLSSSDSLSFFVGEVTGMHPHACSRRCTTRAAHLCSRCRGVQTAEVVLRVSNQGKLPVADLDVALQVS